MGKWICIFWWWQHAVSLQRSTSTITVNMPYKFDKELCELILQIRGIWKDLLSMQLELFGSFPSAAPDPLIDYLEINCILQANEIQHDLLDLRLAIMLEKNLSSLIYSHNVIWPNHYVNLILLWKFFCPCSHQQFWLWPPFPSSLSIHSWTTKSLWICRQCHWAWNIVHSPSPTLSITCTFSITGLHHLMPGASSEEETGGNTWGIFSSWNWRGHRGISPPYWLQMG